MEEVKWVKFLEAFERSQADLVESYFNANGIETQVIQEAYYQYEIGYAAMGPVQILVPSHKMEEAQELYEASGWNFNTTGTDEDDEYEEEEQETGGQSKNG